MGASRHPRRVADKGWGWFSRSRDLLLTILSVVAGLGIAMIPLNFWVGLIISGVAVALFCVAIFELVHGYRLLWILASVLFCGIIIKALWVPDTLSAKLTADPNGVYATDTDIYRIKWNDNFFDFRALIYNESNTDDLTDIDIFVRTDLTIAKVGFAPGLYRGCGAAGERCRSAPLRAERLR